MGARGRRPWSAPLAPALAVLALASALGAADVSLGVKWHTRDGGEVRGPPAVAWLAHVDLDTGSPSFRGRGARPSIRQVMDFALARRTALGTLAGLTLDADGRGRFVSGSAAVVVNRDLTRRTRGFVELAFPLIARAERGGTQVLTNIGTAHLLRPEPQADAAVRLGANPRTPDVSWTVDLSARS